MLEWVSMIHKIKFALTNLENMSLTKKEYFTLAEILDMMDQLVVISVNCSLLLSTVSESLKEDRQGMIEEVEKR